MQLRRISSILLAAAAVTGAFAAPARLDEVGDLVAELSRARDDAEPEQIAKLGMLRRWSCEIEVAPGVFAHGREGTNQGAASASRTKSTRAPRTSASAALKTSPRSGGNW